MDNRAKVRDIKDYVFENKMISFMNWKRVEVQDAIAFCQQNVNNDLVHRVQDTQKIIEKNGYVEHSLSDPDINSIRSVTKRFSIATKKLPELIQAQLRLTALIERLNNKLLSFKTLMLPIFGIGALYLGIKSALKDSRNAPFS